MKDRSQQAWKVIPHWGQSEELMEGTSARQQAVENRRRGRGGARTCVQPKHVWSKRGRKARTHLVIIEPQAEKLVPVLKDAEDRGKAKVT